MSGWATAASPPQLDAIDSIALCSWVQNWGLHESVSGRTGQLRRGELQRLLAVVIGVPGEQLQGGRGLAAGRVHHLVPLMRAPPAIASRVVSVQLYCNSCGGIGPKGDDYILSGVSTNAVGMATKTVGAPPGVGDTFSKKTFSKTTNENVCTTLFGDTISG